MTEIFQLRWPVDRHIVNQFFGANPDFYGALGLPGHEGLDFYAPMNANVYAAAAGEVYVIDHPPDHPYGLHIRLKHELSGKVYRTVYAHLAQAMVSVGQLVGAGDLIGLADNTGNSFGSHLHLTLKVEGAELAGYPPGIVDPWPFFHTTVQELPPAHQLIVFATDWLSLRSEPNIGSDRLAVLRQGEALSVLGDIDAARARVGQAGEWLQVRTEAGLTGFVAAWFVHLTGQSAPTSPLVVFPTHLLSVRAQPATEANRLTTVTPTDPLTVLGDPLRARARIGEYGQWLNVRTSGGHVGYVAAWYVLPEGASSAEAPGPPALPALTVYASVELNLRAQPTTNSTVVGSATLHSALGVLEDDPNRARAKVGQQDQWLLVETEAGVRGWAAAWFVSLIKP